MSWFVLGLLTTVLALATLVAVQRRKDLRRMRGAVEERTELRETGGAAAKLQHPVVDLSRCLGCGTCVAACPEDDVLELVHGQAAVVRGARCIGAGACERECPVDAITVTIADADERRDIPALTPGLEAIGTPGLFLAGEVTAHALIKTALDQGREVAAEVASRVGDSRGAFGEVVDLCVVGAGPAGLSASLEAKRLGLSCVTLDQAEGIGGTVARYPRRKLVTTQPIEIPLHGRVRRTSFEKEELVELWEGIAAEQDLEVRGGHTFLGLSKNADGRFVVRTDQGEVQARHVCLALGRRGAPRKLGVPGEELAKVAYSLLDARSYVGRRVAVIGGGDSAVEAALALGEQAGTEVTLSYRRSAFFRIKGKNQQRLDAAVQEGRVQLALETELTHVRADAIDLRAADGSVRALANDEVFVMAGGLAPLEVLEASGVSFDPALRPRAEAAAERGTGLVPALAAALAMTLLALAFALYHQDYYSLPRVDRPAHPKHELLRPGRGLGLLLGLGSIGLVAVNLLYLVRRSPRFALRFAHLPIGSLKGWMTSHVATGVLAFLLALLHAAMAPRSTVGSHALWALLALLVTGAIGRYLYAWVPRAANGRELEIDEVKGQLAALSVEWDAQRSGFGQEARARIERLVDEGQWSSSFTGRVRGALWGHRELRVATAELRARGVALGLGAAQIADVLDVARRAHRTATQAAHLEDVRAVLGSWRYLHRWAAALMVLLALLHIGHALLYGQMFTSQDGPTEPRVRASVPADPMVKSSSAEAPR